MALRTLSNRADKILQCSPCCLGNYDIVVVGGGIVGMATARQLLECTRGTLSVAVLEKELSPAQHQSGRNSGVIHAGIYYKPGSQRAELCKQGMDLAYDYFGRNNVPYRKVGKLIVATNVCEVPQLNSLFVNATKNGIKGIQLLDCEQLHRIEPYVQAVKAIYSPNTGIVDWGIVTRFFAHDVCKMNGDIHFGFEVKRMCFSADSSADCPDVNKYPISLFSKEGNVVNAGHLLCCGGLYADELAALTGACPAPPVIPVRGEYLVLDPCKAQLIRGNIYPVPDPRFPFLGVHFTPRMDGSIWVGPNAVLAFAREGYKYSDINLKEFWRTLSYRGFQKLAFRNIGWGLKESSKSWFIRAAIKDIKKMVPQIEVSDLKRGPSGVRAQAIDSEGGLIEDFLFDEGSGPGRGRILHCRNAPSPAATSSMAIAHVLANKMLDMMRFKTR